MPTPPNKWAKAARLRLIAELGGRCAKCGRTHDLEIDHPQGRDWEPCKLSSSARVSRYRREAKQGLVRLLCKWCNGADGPWQKQSRAERRSLEREAADAADMAQAEAMQADEVPF